MTEVQSYQEYPVFKGLQKPLEFFGLQGRYIYWAAGTAGGGIVGLIALTVIFLLGHTLNLAINALGAFIHASRLQYVEFFGKFYEDGGEPFDPFRRKTKYIKLED